ADALGADRVGLGRELLGDLRVLDDLVDLLVDELRRGGIGVAVEDQVVVGAEQREAAVAPALLVGRLLLLRRRLVGGLFAHRDIADAEAGLARLLAVSVAVLL